MTTPLVTETPARLEAVAHDPFIDDGTDRAAVAVRAASWAWPTRRPADA